MNGRRLWPIALVLALVAGFVGCDGAGDGERGESAEPRVSSAVEGAGPGRWKEFRSRRRDEGLDEEQREMIAQLEAIGYATGTTEGLGGVGVVRHDAARAQAGRSLYTSGHAPEARLIAMDGTVLHTWRRAFREIWPDHPADDGDPMTVYWRRAHLLPGGELLAVFEGLGLVKLDRHSRVVWARANGAHHDVDVVSTGEIYLLTREAHVIPRVHAREPVLEDFVSVLDANGNVLRRVSMLEAFEGSTWADVIRDRRRETGDIFHTNAIEVLRDDRPELGPAFRAGNVLVSMRELNAIAVVEMAEGRVGWVGRGSFRRQHDPHLLESGSILLFDNSGRGERSRALEVDLATMNDGWAYGGSEREGLYSKWCGTVQRLANGNTLVTESDNGRALEVTPAGEIVWEFQSPHRAGEGGRFVATLFALDRLPEGLPLDWISAGESNADTLPR